MLAGAASATAAVVAAHYTRNGTTVFTAIAVFGYLCAATACADVFMTVPLEATGAILATAATTMLVLSARTAIWTSRLPIPRPADGRIDAGSIAIRAERTTRIVSGLVCGSSAAAAVGAGLAAVGARAEGAAFAVVVAAVLVLRSGTHVDLVQAGALVAGGVVCLGVVFLWMVRTWPQQANWISLGAAGMATVGAALHVVPQSRSGSPVLHRCVELTEYAALIAVIPLACLVCGVFGAVRGLG